MIRFNQNILESVEVLYARNKARGSWSGLTLTLQALLILVLLFLFGAKLMEVSGQYGENLLVPVSILIFVGALLGVGPYYKRRRDLDIESMMKELARVSGGTHHKREDTQLLKALEGKVAIFQGESKRSAEGVSVQDESGALCRLLSYSFTRGSKVKVEYHYFIYGVKIVPSFPHLYLNYKNNFFRINLGERLQTPTEFSKEFNLYMAPGYHIEAMSIFTPDVLAAIQDLPYKCDMEIVDGEMLFVIESTYKLWKNPSALKRELEGIEQIVSLLRPKLEQTSWSPVGDIPHIVKRKIYDK